MTHTLRALAQIVVLVILACAVGTAQAPAPAAAGASLKQAQQLLREGKLDEALAVARKAADAHPTSLQANTQAGIILDLQGQYVDARAYLEKAIAAASTPEEKSRAFRNMAMSFAFERDCPGAANVQQQAYDLQASSSNWLAAAEVANEVARVCLESASVDDAAAWYRKGYDAAQKATNLTRAQKDLWAFRWEHAQGRLAARRGQKEEALRHVAAAKAVLAKGTNPEQAPFLPYLAGYVAFYAGDNKTALAELRKANQNDPFILALIAQTHEKLGDKAAAAELYRKILTFTSHNPTNAYARPLAAEKTGGGRKTP